MSTAFDFQGTVLGVSATSTAEVYIAIGEVREFTINRTAPEIDVSSADSTFREFIPGLPDGGVWNATLNFQSNTTSTATGQFAVLASFNAIESNRFWRLVLDNSSGTDSAYKWTGPVLSYNVSGSVDNQWSLAVSGRVNTTAGTWAAST